MPEPLAVVASSVGGHTIAVITVVGCFVFGISGGLAAIRARLDLFGVAVLAFTVGLAGGTIRDVLLGIRPTALFDWRVIVALFLATIVTIGFRGPLDRWSSSIEVFDAVGLSLFCVLGTDVALEHRAGALPAILLGVITAIGGGIIRDVLLQKTPEVLRQGLYAVPALLGASIVVIGSELGPTSIWWYALGASVCLGVRLIGMRYHVNLPIAPLPEDVVEPD